VLFLDDEASIGHAIKTALCHVGIHVDPYQSVDDFLSAAVSNEHDALVIDWNLRNCEGTEVCRRLRERGECRPIALFSGKLDEDHARELANAAGADGFIAKGISVDVLCDEIRGLVRATETRLRVRKPYRCAVQTEGTIVTIDLGSDHVVLHNHVVHLRPKELAILEALLEQAGKVVTKEQLVRRVWGSRTTPTTSIVETSMSRLRAALGTAASIVQTTTGGYRITLAS